MMSDRQGVDTEHADMHDGAMLHAERTPEPAASIALRALWALPGDPSAPSDD